MSVEVGLFHSGYGVSVIGRFGDLGIKQTSDGVHGVSPESGIGMSLRLHSSAPRSKNWEDVYNVGVSSLL